MWATTFNIDKHFNKKVLTEMNNHEFPMNYDNIIFSANGDGASGNVSRSMPSSPGDKNRQPQSSIPVVGSAENLVGRVSFCVFKSNFWRW